ncbi:MAG: AAA family ATPase [Bacteroidota bacterium]
MISTLKITNFALIAQLELRLNSGFSVITGETGSGKSILLGALELLLGERADFSLIGSQGDKAIVEANVHLSNYHLETFFSDNDLDYEDDSIIRREISTSGRSRAFINDSPVQLTVLRELTSQLVNIHSQYNTLELRDKNYQLEMLDILGGLTSNRQQFEVLFYQYKKELADLNTKTLQLLEIQKQGDYIQFQLEELEDLQLSTTDYAELETQLNKAENAEQIIRTLSTLESGITDDTGALLLFSKGKVELDKLKSIDENLNSFFERTNAITVELKELSSDLTSYVERLELNPAMKEQLLVKLDGFNRALRKHNLKNQEELVELKAQFENSTQQTQQLEEEIEVLQLKVAQLEKEVQKKASEIHILRVQASPSIESELQLLLNELKLEGTELRFLLSEKQEISATGITGIAILFSANKGVEAVPIEKAASGGELSRVMLALQKLISDRKALPTVLFDEIDTGVSGEVAQKMGNLLRRMGESRQLIAITHLPQVAAKAQQHFKVEKSERDGRTQSQVRLLGTNETVQEVARLMSGEVISNAALQTAKALIDE